MSPLQPHLDQFEALAAHGSWLIHGFCVRARGVDCQCPREEAIARLNPRHRSLLLSMGVPSRPPMIGVEQVHGAEVAVALGPQVDGRGCDAILTDVPGLTLGIYVADCAPVWIVDPVRRAVGVIHSGKKGTELQITTAAVQKMCDTFGSRPKDMLLLVGPCIRPPLYETDFVAEILHQGQSSGVGQIIDCKINSATNLQRYYSYRQEKGMTGRMLAFVHLRGPATP